MLTSSVARVERALDLAERTFDVKAAERLTMQAHHLTADYREAHLALVNHRESTHPVRELEPAARF